MKRLALAFCALAAAPVHGVEVARVQVVTPVSAYMTGAAAVGTDINTRIGPLTNPGLSGPAALSITSKLTTPVLVPTVIPTAPETVFAPPAQGFSAPAVAPQAVTAIPLSIPFVLAPAGGAAVLQQAAEQQNTPAAAVKTLQGFVARMESSRVSGKDVSNELSNRFFDQSGTRGPPVAAPAQVSDLSAPLLPPGVKSVSVDTVRTARDIDRLIPNGPNSNGLKAELMQNVSEMAPYQIYTYRDSRGGSFVGIDLAANPKIVERIPELQPHEVTLIKRLMLVNSDIRVLVREAGRTPDLVIGNQVVEMKSEMNHFPLMKLVDKANMQVLEHAERHGLGHGSLALEMDLSKDGTAPNADGTVPVAKVQSLLNSWQSYTRSVALDRIIVLGQKDVKIFVRQRDGTYQLEAPAVAVPGMVNERPLAPSERSRAQAMLRNGIEKSPVLALSL